MKIYLAADHAGMIAKEKIKEYLLFANHQVIDFGANIYNPIDDYPDFVHEAGKSLCVDNKNLNSDDFLKINSIAFVFGGSGTGEAIVMNRYNNVRCAVIYQYNEDIVKLSRQHNNANALSFGVRFLETEQIQKMIDIFLQTQFEGDRHISRIGKIEQKL